MYDSEQHPASGGQREIVPGDLYSFTNDDGTYSIVKVLVVDDFALHLRSYANRFDKLPTDVDPSTLTLGSIDDELGFGVGHFPVAKEGFFDDDPLFIKKVPVTENELDGYYIYLEAMSNDLPPVDFDLEVDRDPTNAFLYHGRGICRSAEGEFDKAIADFSTAIRLDSGK